MEDLINFIAENGKYKAKVSPKVEEEESAAPAATEKTAEDAKDAKETKEAEHDEL